MVERVGKVARMKGVSYDVGHSFDRKEGYEDQDSGKKFSNLFQREKRRQAEEKDGVPAAYRLEVGRATQSLFYENGFDFRALRSKLKAYQ